MATIQNIERLQHKLEKLVDRYRSEGTPSVVVGYTANYAIYVHERQARHSPGKQSKFLEQPAREMGAEIGDTIALAVKRGVKLLPALYMGGVKLQTASERIVPVDTGNLRGSSFTAREDELESVIAEKDIQLVKRVSKQKAKWEKKTAKQKSRYRKKQQERMRGWKKS